MGPARPSLDEFADRRNRTSRADYRTIWSFLNRGTAPLSWLLQSPPIPEGGNPAGLSGLYIKETNR